MLQYLLFGTKLLDFSSKFPFHFYDRARRIFDPWQISLFSDYFDSFKLYKKMQGIPSAYHQLPAPFFLWLTAFSKATLSLVQHIHIKKETFTYKQYHLRVSLKMYFYREFGTVDYFRPDLPHWPTAEREKSPDKTDVYWMERTRLKAGRRWTESKLLGKYWVLPNNFITCLDFISHSCLLLNDNTFKPD